MRATLRDPTVWHWWLFVRWHGRDTSDHVVSHQEEFNDAVRAAMRWAGSNAEPMLHAGLSPRHTSVRLASVPWHQTPHDTRTLEARTLLDAFYLQTGCAVRGILQPAAFAQLRAADWKLGVPGHAFLGEALCLSAEVIDAGGEPTDLARAALEAWFGESVHTVAAAELDFGLLAADQGQAEETWVLLASDSADAHVRASQMVHLLLPPLLLSRVKGRRLAEQFEHGILQGMHKMERLLDDEVGRLGKRPGELDVLEAASERIARHQLDTARVVSEAEELLETLRISIANAERLLEDPLVANRRVALHPLLIGDLALAAQQVTADLRYSTIRQLQGDRELQSIATMVEVRDARWSRRTTILLGVFVAFSAAQSFPELSPVVRGLLIAVGGLAVYAAIRWMSRRP